jgi:hypothetical protein
MMPDLGVVFGDGDDRDAGHADGASQLDRGGLSEEGEPRVGVRCAAGRGADPGQIVGEAGRAARDCRPCELEGFHLPRVCPPPVVR